MNKRAPLPASQPELDLSPPSAPASAEELADRGRRLYREEVVPAFKRAVDRITLKEAAWLLKSTAPKILDAIDGRDRKAVKLEWLVVLLLTAPEDVRLDLVSVINKLAGFQRPEKKKALTPEEELRIYRRSVAQLAPGIVSTIEEELDRA